MKVKLEGRNIPRNKAGDPAFAGLGDRFGTPPGVLSVLEVFTPEEIVELVNRALYQLEYQKESHRTRAQAERDRWAPVKEALKVVHPHTPFSKATERQIEDALKY